MSVALHALVVPVERNKIGLGIYLKIRMINISIYSEE